MNPKHVAAVNMLFGTSKNRQTGQKRGVHNIKVAVPMSETLGVHTKARGVVNMKRIERTFHISVIIIAACILMYIFCVPAQALESGSYRLLSVSVSEKLVLVSRIPDQKKFLLDAADVKITINDNTGEFDDLNLFTIVQVKMDLGKTKRKGVNIDGRAREIAISNPAEK
jgi:hypothetical protein